MKEIYKDFIFKMEFLVFLNTTELIRQMVGMEQCAGRPDLFGQFKGKGPRRGLLDPDIGPFWKDQ